MARILPYFEEGQTPILLSSLQKGSKMNQLAGLSEKVLAIKNPALSAFIEGASRPYIELERAYIPKLTYFGLLWAGGLERRVNPLEYQLPLVTFDRVQQLADIYVKDSSVLARDYVEGLKLIEEQNRPLMDFAKISLRITGSSNEVIYDTLGLIGWMYARLHEAGVEQALMPKPIYMS